MSKILSIGFNFHVVGIAALCWAIWKTRNKACFKGKLISSLVSLIYYMCSFHHYWAGLQTGNDKELLLEGASRLQRGATAAHDVASSSMVRIQQLENNSVEDDDEDVTID
jgi:hypothetical protein